MNIYSSEVKDFGEFSIAKNTDLPRHFKT